MNNEHVEEVHDAEIVQLPQVSFPDTAWDNELLGHMISTMQEQLAELVNFKRDMEARLEALQNADMGFMGNMLKNMFGQ